MNVTSKIRSLLFTAPQSYRTYFASAIFVALSLLFLFAFWKSTPAALALCGIFLALLLALSMQLYSLAVRSAHADDAARPDEREILKRWLPECPVFSRECLHYEKGAAILRRTVSGRQ